MAYKRVLGLLVLALATLSRAQLTQEVIGDEVLISYNGREIFRQTPTEPILTLGRGEANFTEVHGMFEIEEDLESVILVDRVISANNMTGDVRLTLGSTVDTEIEVRLTMYPSELYPDNLELIVTGPSSYNRLWMRMTAKEDEMVFGGGEQYSYLNLRGRHFPIWTSEQGIGRDGGIIANVTDIDGGAGGEYYTTYWPDARFVSSERYSVTFDVDGYSVLNFTSPDYHEFYVHDNGFIGSMKFAETMMDSLQYIPFSLPALPDWILTGSILSVQRGTEEVVQYYEMAKAAGVNVSALWIQDWSGTTETLFGHRVYWNWRWNETYYPGLDELILDLAQEGVGVMAYTNPHLIEGSTMFEEADAQGFLLKDSEGASYVQDFGGFMAGTVDLADSDASAWYANEIVKNMIDLGLKGWMADFGEYTRTDMVSKMNAQYTPQEIHNLLPKFWAECNSLALHSSGKAGQVVPFMRSGGHFSHKYTQLAWAGDQNVDWSIADGVASTIVAALNLGLSGMCVTHFDIGGYTTQPPVLKRSKELFLRSAEYAVFTPVMRTHEGNKPNSNHQFYTDEDTLLQFARLTQIHSKLVPYTRTLVKACVEEGTPAQAPMFLYFENDPGSWNVTYQYMFGPDLIVAPIIHKGQDSQTIYIPGDDSSWQHLWEGVVVSGPTNVEVYTPMGYPAVFFRSDSPFATLFLEIAAEYGAPWV